MNLNYCWRVVATGLSFALFGLGGIVIAVVAIPIGLCLTPQRREAVAKRLIHHTFRLFINTMWMLGILTYDGDALDDLRHPGQLIIANHPTLLDIVFLIAMVPDGDCILKGALLSNPFMRGAIRFAGYISNDDPQIVVKLAAESLDRGNCLIVFPEGTRTRRDEELRFVRGAANIAIRTRSDLRPVIITCDPLTLGKGEPWYQVPERPFHYHLSVRDTIGIVAWLDGEPTRSSRKLTEYLEKYYLAERGLSWTNSDSKLSSRSS